jgi:hypothetical protein
MAESNISRSLRSKRDELEGLIAAYEGKIEECRRDLAHINATLSLFEQPDSRDGMRPRMGLGKLFRRGEVFKICQEALEAAPDGLDTRELALAVILAKGMDDRDAVLKKAVAFNIVQTLTMRHKRGQIGDAGKRRGVRVWQR